MRTRALTLLCLAVTLLICAAAPGAGAQDLKNGQVVLEMKGGYFVAFATTPGPSAGGASSFSTSYAETYGESDIIRRVFVDGSLYFGYALTVEPLAGSQQFRITVRPLGPEDEAELRTRKIFHSRRLHPNYGAAGLSRSSAPQIVSDGDAFALDVLVNPRTGGRVTDFVTVSADEARARVTPGEEMPPRDFTVADVEMKMINYRLIIDGEPVAGGRRSGACAGPVIWFHLPGRGRFIFSLTPHEGYDFKKLGTIESNRLKFTVNGERFEWVSDVPVVGASGNWNLYVLHDAAYVPDSFFMGANAQPKPARRSDSALEKLDKPYPLPKRAGAAGFGNTSDPKKEGEAANAAGARLIIGAANRVENLLPRN